jgi:hypothetical protein
MTSDRDLQGVLKPKPSSERTNRANQPASAAAAAPATSKFFLLFFYLLPFWYARAGRPMYVCNARGEAQFQVLHGRRMMRTRVRTGIVFCKLVGAKKSG